MERADGFIGKGRLIYATEADAQLSFLDGVAKAGFEMLLQRPRTFDGDEPKWVPPLREAVLWLADRIREDEKERERIYQMGLMAKD